MMGTSSGTLAGAGLGALGALADAPSRYGLASLLALPATAVGVAAMFGVRISLLQVNRETSQRLMNLGPYWWASLNGLALGVGAVSRIGFPLWYVVPFAALISGDAWFGGLLYGLYALVRTGSAVAVIGFGQRDKDFVRRMLGYRRRAEIATASLLTITGLLTAIGVGL